MVSIFEAIILGIVQGITEWLPVSSSGHLVIVQKLFGIENPINLSLLLHIATLLVVLVMFQDDIKKIILSIFRKDDPYRKLLYMLVIATIPTALIGFVLKDTIESAFNSIWAVGIGLIVTSIILALTYFGKKIEEKQYMKGIEKHTVFDSIVVGVFQGMAIFPGVSRSGSTISAALYKNFNRELAARFSFLLFIPAMLGATLLEFDKLTFSSAELMPAFVGAIVAIITSYFAIKWLLNIVKKGKLYQFSIYCLIVGITLLLI